MPTAVKFECVDPFVWVSPAVTRCGADSKVVGWGMGMGMCVTEQDARKRDNGGRRGKIKKEINKKVKVTQYAVMMPMR